MPRRELLLLLALPLASIANAQLDWRPGAASGFPAAADSSAMVVDPTGGGLLMFGGGSNGGLLDTTHRWRSGVWTQLQPAVRPPARIGPGLAADLVRSRVVLFGGGDSFANALADTWEWDGVTWTPLQPAVSPSPRVSPVMTYDSVRARTVLTGGWALSGGPFTDTWLWSGSQWTLALPATMPPLSTTNMVFDASRGVAVMANRTSTYEWDGTNWRFAGAGIPAYGGTLAYDAARQRVTWFGARDNAGYPVALGVYDRIGTSWVSRPTATNPPLRTACVFTFDPESEWIVCFGGRNDNLPPLQIRLSDTWALAPVQPAFANVFGSGCLGSNGVPRMQANRPWLGDLFDVSWSNLPPAGAPLVLAFGTSNQTWSGSPLPFSLAGMGMPGCHLLVSPDASILTSASSASLVTNIQVPLNAALAGLDLFLQGLVVDAAANVVGVTSSNGIAARIGSR